MDGEIYLWKEWLLKVKRRSVPVKPTPWSVMPSSSLRVAWNLLSVVPAAAPTVQGLTEMVVASLGPLFPPAWTTNIPALRANRREISNALSKLGTPSGGSSGPMERINISTPSWAAYTRKSNRYLVPCRQIGGKLGKTNLGRTRTLIELLWWNDRNFFC